jgi:small subunit ribosomal protein S16
LSVKIRLSRTGRKKKPSYRLVVVDSRRPRDGRIIECVGHYNPLPKNPEIQIEESRILYWMDKGATPSDTVRNLLKMKGVIYRRFLKKKGFDEATVDEKIKKWEVLQIDRERRKAEKPARKKKAEEGATAKAEEQAKPAATPESVKKESEASAAPSSEAPKENPETKEKPKA